MSSFDPRFLNRHLFVFNPEDNGDASLNILTEHFAYSPLEILTHQEITLQSMHGSSSTFAFPGFLTPEKLRKLADELEKAQVEAVDIAQAMIDKTH